MGCYNSSGGSTKVLTPWSTDNAYLHIDELLTDIRAFCSLRIQGVLFNANV